jgi:hypothetical protein
MLKYKPLYINIQEKTSMSIRVRESGMNTGITGHWNKDKEN